MNQKIKRVKGGVVAWAKTIAKAGNVSDWTPDESKAFGLDPDDSGHRALAVNVALYHRERSNVGVITFEPAGKPINDAAKALAEEAAHKKAEANSLATLRDKAGRFDAAERSRSVAEDRLKDALAVIVEL